MTIEKYARISMNVENENNVRGGVKGIQRFQINKYETELLKMVSDTGFFNYMYIKLLWGLFCFYL